MQNQTGRKLIVSMNLTLDGIMEGPVDDPEKQHQVWTFPFRNDAFATFELDELSAADALLLGRVTYQGLSPAWPALTEDEQFGKYAELINSLPKHVASATLEEPLEWNASLIKGNLAEEVSRLKQQSGQNILITGSGELVHSLMQHDLIDVYRFKVYPVVLGGGRRLFRDESVTTNLNLIETKNFDTGIVVLTYHKIQEE